MILIILLYMLCAMSFTLAKTALNASQPFFFVGIRMIWAGLALIAFYWIVNRKKISIRPMDWFLLGQVSLFGVFFAYNLDLWSLQFLTSIESALVFNVSPFCAALMSYYWFSEVMTNKKWIGLLLGVSSLLPLIFSQGLVVQPGALTPIFVLLLSVMSSAYGWIVIRDLVKLRNFSPIEINGITMSMGGIASLILSYIVEPWSPTPVSNWKAFLLATAAIIVICNFLFSNLYGYLLKRYTATLLSFAGFLCPVFATGFGWFFLNEPISKGFIYSFSAIILGLYIFYKEELRQGYIQQ